jgi:hypothetical protein
MRPGFFRVSFCKDLADIRRSVPAFKEAYADTIKELTGK